MRLRSRWRKLTVISALLETRKTPTCCGEGRERSPQAAREWYDNLTSWTQKDMISFRIGVNYPK
jgi:hypothetical protein